MKTTHSILYSETWKMWFRAEWLPTNELFSIYPEVPASSATSADNSDLGDPRDTALINALTTVYLGHAPRITLAPATTPFGMRTRELLWLIQPGSPITYGEAAERLGSRGAARAVGQACSRNNFAVLIPCHRIVGFNGLGGYRWGLPLKRELLMKERKDD